MDIRIIKGNVSFCTVCNEVSEERSNWDKEQKQAVDDGRQEEPAYFPGVPGYTIKDANASEYSYEQTCICEGCLRTIMRGVNIITEQDLLGISLRGE